MFYPVDAAGCCFFALLVVLVRVEVCNFLLRNATNELMTEPQQALWEELKHFRLDEPGVPLPFSARLARENNWKLHYALRAVHEYRRFIFLACEAGHPVTPSVVVDQVWHLHLVYTQSYWKDLCGNLLGKEIHHGPTPGGQEAQGNYRSLYQQTLDSYERLFAQVPPADIWPSVEQRFASFDLQWVDRARYWVLRKWW